MALPVFVASAIAKSDINKSGWLACRLGIVAYLVPFVFAFKPELLLKGYSWTDIVPTLVVCTIGMIGVVYGVGSFIYAKSGVLHRAILIAGGKIYFEINEAMGIPMMNLLNSRKYTSVELIKDLSGRDRIIKAIRNA